MAKEIPPVSLDMIKPLLGSAYKGYEEGLLNRKSNNFCDLCRKWYAKHYDGDFPVHCEGAVTEQLSSLKHIIPPDEWANYISLADPVAWAVKEFDWFADWYQAQYLRCSSIFKVGRLGRRSGKSAASCVAIIHKCMTKPNKKLYEPYTVVLVTPYDAQATMLFDNLRDLISRSKNITTVRDTKNPHLIEFPNNSKILGFTAGIRTGAQSDKVRGMDADFIYLDEADFLTPEDLDSILAIQASHPHCEVWMTSTPRGIKSKFMDMCNDKSMHFKEFWRVSLESPRYTDRTHDFFLKTYTQIAFNKEILAMFGEPEEGVFPKDLVNASLRKYDYADCVLDKNNMYIMGVDWNDRKHGGHIVVNSWNPEEEQFKLVDKKVIKGLEFTQTGTVQAIIDMNHKWAPKYIAVDEGYGNAQIEALKLFGLRNPSTRLHEKVSAINMSSKISVRDPHTGHKVKKMVKPLMVQLSQARLERFEQIFPNSEDSREDEGLVDQMRAFLVERIGKTGMPIYSDGYDHTIIAWMLTILTFMMNETELGYSNLGVNLAIVDAKRNPNEKVVDPQDDLSLRPKRMPLAGWGKAPLCARAVHKPGVKLSHIRKQLRPQTRRTF